MAGKTAFVFGASGLTGGFVVKDLLQNPIYEKVILPVRKPLVVLHPKAQEIPLDGFESYDLNQTPAENIHVYCCLGTTIKQAGSQEAFRNVDLLLPLKIAAWANKKEIQTFVVMSSIGANAKSGNFYLRTKGEMEEGIASWQFPHLYILRPSFLLGPRDEFRLGEEIAKMLSGVLNVVLFGPLKKYRPVEVSKVARAMIKLANSDEKDTVFETDRIESISIK